MVTLVITGIHALYEYRLAKQDIREHLQQVQPLLQQGMSAAVWFLDLDQIGRLAEGAVRSQGVSGIRVFNESDQLLLESGLVAPAPHLAVSDLLATRANTETRHSLLSHRFSLNPVAGATGGTGMVLGSVELFADSRLAADKVGQMFGWIFLAAILKAVALWLIVSYFGRRLLSRPLARLLAKLRTLPLDGADAERLTPDDANHDEVEVLDHALDGIGQKLTATLGELRDANTQLSQSNWQLQRAVEQSPASITIFTIDGKVLYTNPGFTRITGYQPAEADGAYAHHLNQRQKLREVMAAFLEGRIEENRVYFEVENQRRDGEGYWVGVVISPVRSPEGDITHFLSSATDITSRKIAESALNRKTLEQQQTIAKLETAHNQLLQSEKMASIGQLAAGVAHEINNPIGYVNSNLGSLRHYLSDLLALVDAYHQADSQEEREQALALRRRIDFDFVKEDLVSLLDESEEGLNRVKQIIKDLKDFSHVDSAEWVRSDLLRGLNSTLNVVWNELKYKAEVVKEYQPLPEIDCMPSQINQVFMNLLVNAAHAIDGRGVITLRTGVDGERVWIEVEDNGRGIAPEHLSRLFEPFFTTKAVGKGTGLGLSVSYGIVNKHHGEITVESTPGEGSKFRVWLPLRQPETQDESDEAVSR